MCVCVCVCVGSDWGISRAVFRGAAMKDARGFGEKQAAENGETRRALERLNVERESRNRLYPDLRRWRKVWTRERGERERERERESQREREPERERERARNWKSFG